MTVTEAPRDATDATDATGVAAVETEPTSPAGLAAVVGSGDPRAVGKLFVGTALLFLLVSAGAGLLVGFEQIDLARRDDVLASDTFAQVFTMHTVVGLLLGVLPLLLGLATAVVPLQVGASTVAFPRASAAAYWTYLVSGGLVIAAYAVNGGPFGGDEGGVALFVTALIAAIAALCTATVSVVTTVVTLRAPGMSLRRTPLFSWSMLVAGSVWLLTLPVLAGVLLLVYLDLTYGQVFLGGADRVYEHLSWVFWQPTLYAFAVPALGIIGDIVPVFAQTRHKRHRAAMVLIGLFGALGVGAWAQLVPNVGGEGGGSSAPWAYDGPWIVVGVLAVLPILGLLWLWNGTLRAGRPRLASPLLFALVSGALLLLGVGAGIPTVIEKLDLLPTTWMTAQMYAVLAGTLTAALGGLAFWAPKIYGSLVPEAPARLVATLLLIGTAALAVPYGIAGLLDQPQWLGAEAQLDDTDTVEVLNLVAAIGGAVLAAALLLAVLTVLRGALARGRARVPGDDPWRGHTLEWVTSSPPPAGNFANGSLPEVTSEAPLYDARHAAGASGSTTPTAASAATAQTANREASA
jgi:heme/copper-type cytochrome/quinol oxidase subunit 1